MATFAEWCAYYGYIDNHEARSDYQRYKEEYALLRSLVEEAAA